MPITRRIAAVFALLLAVAGCATRPAPGGSNSVLLVSVDGLRPTDITAASMPVLNALGQAGVRAEGMRPSYPTLTFPNHYSVVTGLRPDRHGIVHNSMRDAGLGTFRPSNREAVGSTGWWGGVPVWISAERAGLRTATLFWPGSEAEIEGVRPREWRPYEEGTNPAANAATVAAWLAAPEQERPRFATLYFDQVDEASHAHGPDSAEAQAARANVDAALGLLVRRLRDSGRLAHTNLVIVSDHGFETVRPAQRLSTDALVPADVAEAISDGQVVGFAPLPGKTAAAEHALLGRHATHACWRKSELPAHWDYGSHPRIPAIVCQMAPGWEALWPNKAAWLAKNQPDQVRGAHGYDPDLPQMRASFIASGPAFRTRTRLPVFDNVDVYPLLMHLLQLPAEAGDGELTPLLPALRGRP